jgi:hypothetical protein
VVNIWKVFTFCSSVHILLIQFNLSGDRIECKLMWNIFILQPLCYRQSALMQRYSCIHTHIILSIYIYVYIYIYSSHFNHSIRIEITDTCSYFTTMVPLLQYLYSFTYLCSYMYIYIYAYVYIYVHRYIYTYICIYIYVYIHITCHPYSIFPGDQQGICHAAKNPMFYKCI